MMDSGRTRAHYYSGPNVLSLRTVVCRIFGHWWRNKAGIRGGEECARCGARQARFYIDAGTVEDWSESATWAWGYRDDSEDGR